jgi:SAM-dependent methyltransferase
MKQFDEATYGQRIAAVYDQLYGEYEEAAVGLLQEFATGGRALELGIGTGRIALPLQQRGVEVWGVDSSPAMIARLRAKPGGNEIEVLESSFADFELRAHFDLIYVVFNTFFGLLTQEDQVRCFHSVARHLGDGGHFLLEVFVPDPCRFDAQQTVRAVQVEADEVKLDVTRHDPVRQQVNSQHVWLSEDGIRLFPVALRYAWPAELDLMARLAGLQLKHRWDSWDKAAFSAGSTRHISVYGRDA